MSKPKYIMNEVRYVKDNILKNKSYKFDKDFSKDLYLVIKYACKFYKGKRRKWFIRKFIIKNGLEYIKWEDFINNTIKTIDKNNIKIKEFDSIPITESDWNYISSLDNQLEKKVLFTLIVLSKYVKIDNPSEANISYSFSEIHKLANMNNIKKVGKIETESSLCDLGLVNIKIIRDKREKGGKTIYNVPCSLNNGNVLFDVICRGNELNNIGKTYNDMKKIMEGAKFKRCERCGVVIFKKSNAQYCDKCAEEIDNRKRNERRKNNKNINLSEEN